MFDDVGDIDEWEASRFDTSVLVSHPDNLASSNWHLEQHEKRIQQSSPSAPIKTNTKKTTIMNLSVSIDGYEGVKVAFFDEEKNNMDNHSIDLLSSSSRYIYFDLDKKTHSAAADNDSARLTKVLLLKYLLRISVKLIGTQINRIIYILSY